MKKWFYLEPYTFIFNGIQGKIIYNTLNGSIVNVPSIIYSLLSGLEDDENGYCVELDETILADKTIYSFIQDIRENFSGDIIEALYKPFVCKPILNLLNDPRKILAEEGSALTTDLLSNVHEVNIYLNSSCTLECEHCSEYCKQFLWCSTFGEMKPKLVLEDYENLFGFLSTVGIKQMNFLGGDVFQSNMLDSLGNLANKYSINNRVCIHFLHLKRLLKKKVDINKYSYIVFARAQDINEKDLIFCRNINISIEWKIAVTSVEEYLVVEEIFNKETIKVDIFPFYDRLNYDFFFNNIFIDLEEITSLVVSKQEIFAKQVLNTNFFGKLFILPNGDIYTNMNNKSLGNLQECSLNEAVYKELKYGNSWLNVRNIGVCSQCMYRYLCPPISNYELVLKQMNLCHVLK